MEDPILTEEEKQQSMIVLLEDELPLDVRSTIHLVRNGEVPSSDVDEDPIYSRYICCVCKNILLNPTTCATGHHMGCLECWKKIADKKCPLCHTVLPSVLLINPLYPALQVWMSVDLGVRCPRKDLCSWTGEWGIDGHKLHHHYTVECPGRIVYCSLDAACRHRMRPVDKDAHESICGFRLVPCERCGTLLRKNRISGHLCPQARLPCPHTSDDGIQHSFRRADRDEHMTTCGEAKEVCYLCTTATELGLWQAGETRLPDDSYRRKNQATHWADFTGIHQRAMHARYNDTLKEQFVANNKRKFRAMSPDEDDDIYE